MCFSVDVSACFSLRMLRACHVEKSKGKPLPSWGGFVSKFLLSATDDTAIDNLLKSVRGGASGVTLKSAVSTGERTESHDLNGKGSAPC